MTVVFFFGGGGLGLSLCGGVVLPAGLEPAPAGLEPAPAGL